MQICVKFLMYQKNIQPTQLSPKILYVTYDPVSELNKRQLLFYCLDQSNTIIKYEYALCDFLKYLQKEINSNNQHQLFDINYDLQVIIKDLSNMHIDTSRFIEIINAHIYDLLAIFDKAAINNVLFMNFYDTKLYQVIDTCQKYGEYLVTKLKSQFLKEDKEVLRYLQKFMQIIGYFIDILQLYSQGNSVGIVKFSYYAARIKLVAQDLDPNLLPIHQDLLAYFLFVTKTMLEFYNMHHYIAEMLPFLNVKCVNIAIPLFVDIKPILCTRNNYIFYTKFQKSSDKIVDYQYKYQFKTLSFQLQYIDRYVQKYPDNAEVKNILTETEHNHLRHLQLLVTSQKMLELKVQLDPRKLQENQNVFDFLAIFTRLTMFLAHKALVNAKIPFGLMYNNNATIKYQMCNLITKNQIAEYCSTSIQDEYQAKYEQILKFLQIQYPAFNVILGVKETQAFSKIYEVLCHKFKDFLIQEDLHVVFLQLLHDCYLNIIQHDNIDDICKLLYQCSMELSKGFLAVMNIMHAEVQLKNSNTHKILAPLAQNSVDRLDQTWSQIIDQELLANNMKSWPTSVSVSLQSQQEQVVHQVLKKTINNNINVDKIKIKDYYSYDDILYDNIGIMIDQYHALAEIFYTNQQLFSALVPGVVEHKQELFCRFTDCNKPWISAKYAIHAISRRAFEVLLRHPIHFMSGFNIKNLPLGFKVKQQTLGFILTYNPEFQRSNITPLTVKLRNYDQCKVYYGPLFTQFKIIFNDFLQEFIQHRVIPIADKLEKLLAYAYLLPSNETINQQFCNYLADVSALSLFNCQIKSTLKNLNIVVIKSNLIAFLCMYADDFTQGLLELNLQSCIDLKSKKTAIALLVTNASDRQLLDLFEQHQLRVFSQVYEYDQKSFQNLLLLLHKLMTVVGSGYFQKLLPILFNVAQNVDVVLSSELDDTIQQMIDVWSTAYYKFNLENFIAIAGKHVPLQYIPACNDLWHGYRHFCEKLKQLSVKLNKPDIFVSLNAGNMLIHMDRMLLNLNNLPFNVRQDLLDTDYQLDLTYTGIHYAIVFNQHTLFQYNKILQFTNFLQDDLSPGFTNGYAGILTKDLINSIDINNTMLNSYVLTALRALAGPNKLQEADRILVLDLLQTYAAHHNYNLYCLSLSIWLLFTNYDNKKIMDVAQQILSMPTNGLNLINQLLISTDYQMPLAVLLKYCQNPNVIQHIATLSKHMFPQDIIMIMHNLFVMNCDINLLNQYLDSGIAILKISSNWMDLQTDLLIIMSLCIANHHDYAEFLQKMFNISADMRTLEYEQDYILVKNFMRQLLSIDNNSINNLSIDNRQLVAQNMINYLSKLYQLDFLENAQNHDEFVENLILLGVRINNLQTSTYRTLTNIDCENITTLEPVKQFMLNHVLLPKNVDYVQLNALNTIFQNLATGSSVISNMLTLCLATLNQAPLNHYWHINYLYDLFQTLWQDRTRAFPLYLLKTLLNTNQVNAQNIKNLEPSLPHKLKNNLINIINNDQFNSAEKNILLYLVGLDHGSLILADTISILAKARPKLQYDLLKFLGTSKTLVIFHENMRLLTLILQIFTQAIDDRGIILLILQNLMTDKPMVLSWLDNVAPRAKALLTIMVSSVLARDQDVINSYKIGKLYRLLQQLPLVDLDYLIKCYDKDELPPAPDLLRVIKLHQPLAFTKTLENYVYIENNHSRIDYGALIPERQQYLLYLLEQTEITQQNVRTVLSPEQRVNVQTLIANIQDLESNAALYKKSHENLRIQFYDKATSIAESWAILFEIIATTTKKYPDSALKYPHLAQKIAVLVQSLLPGNGIISLPTGEGKSHVIAMLAAHWVRMQSLQNIKIKIEICTANRVLAHQGFETYKKFFKNLSINAICLDNHTSFQDYHESQICFTTLLDCTSMHNNAYYKQLLSPDELQNPPTIFGMIDEFDYLAFIENFYVDQNYISASTEIQDSTWFYAAVNDYYLNYYVKYNNTVDIQEQSVMVLKQVLSQAAQDRLERQELLKEYCGTLQDLLQIINSAVIVHNILKEDIDFTIITREQVISGELLCLRWIIPLSLDNQLLLGASYSAGVHQLLAEKLNAAARQCGELDNFYAPALEKILSSLNVVQQIETLWQRWVGFTGTLSPLQISLFNKNSNITVLHALPNQKVARVFEPSQFFANDIDRIYAVVRIIRECFKTQQSLLLACINDKQVCDIKSQLDKILSAMELQNCIFHTNANSTENFEALLKNKTILERWQLSTKQQGVILVSAGCTLGVNPAVDMVIILDPRDWNTLLQVAGRVARNGAVGTVLPFYLFNELQLTYEKLKILYPDRAVININNYEVLATEVLFLQEISRMQQQNVRLVYRYVVSQFSVWVMRAFVLLSDEQLKRNWEHKIFVARADLENLWHKMTLQQPVLYEIFYDKIQEIASHMSIWLQNNAIDYNKAFILSPIEDALINVGQLCPEMINYYPQPVLPINQAPSVVIRLGLQANNNLQILCSTLLDKDRARFIAAFHTVLDYTLQYFNQENVTFFQDMLLKTMNDWYKDDLKPKTPSYKLQIINFWENCAYLIQNKQFGQQYMQLFRDAIQQQNLKILWFQYVIHAFVVINQPDRCEDLLQRVQCNDYKKLDLLRDLHALTKPERVGLNFENYFDTEWDLARKVKKLHIACDAYLKRLSSQRAGPISDLKIQAVQDLKQQLSTVNPLLNFKQSLSGHMKIIQHSRVADGYELWHRFLRTLHQILTFGRGYFFKRTAGEAFFNHQAFVETNVLERNL